MGNRCAVRVDAHAYQVNTRDVLVFRVARHFQPARELPLTYINLQSALTRCLVLGRCHEDLRR